MNNEKNIIKFHYTWNNVTNITHAVLLSNEELKDYYMEIENPDIEDYDTKQIIEINENARLYYYPKEKIATVVGERWR